MAWWSLLGLEWMFWEPKKSFWNLESKEMETPFLRFYLRFCENTFWS